MTNSRTGKVERVFVDLQAVYPNANDSNEEMSFEELRAQSRGWLSVDWAAENKRVAARDSMITEDLQQKSLSPVPVSVLEDVMNQPMQHSDFESQRTGSQDYVIEEARAQETKIGRPKKIKIMEVKAETQTSMTSELNISVYR